MTTIDIQAIKDYLLGLQDRICDQLAQQETSGQGFLQDEWQREQGGGGWAWPERFGRVEVDGGKVTGALRPRLLHTFNETKYPIPLPLPVFAEAGKAHAGTGTGPSAGYHSAVGRGGGAGARHDLTPDPGADRPGAGSDAASRA